MGEQQSRRQDCDQSGLAKNVVNNRNVMRAIPQNQPGNY
jgi:hypothetical protein